MVMKSAHLLRLVKGRYLFLSLVFVLSTLLSSLSGFFSQNDIASAACASGEKADNGKCYARVGLTGGEVVGKGLMTIDMSGAPMEPSYNSPMSATYNCLETVVSFANQEYSQSIPNNNAGWVREGDNCVWYYWKATTNTPDSGQTTSSAESQRNAQWNSLAKWCSSRGISGPNVQDCTNHMFDAFNTCLPKGSPAKKNTEIASCIAQTDPMFANDADKMLFVLNQEAKSSAATYDGTKTDGGKTKCSPDIGNLGWLICPVMDFFAGVNDGVFTFLADNFLSVHPKLFDEKSGTRTAWVVFRNIANVAFIIAFLIIVLSQVTSVGISNYGIKKLLPKLVVAAVLVNLSFYVCQAMVDMSNVLGYGLNSLFASINVRGANGLVQGAPVWLQITGNVLSGVGLVGIGLFLAIGLGLGVVVMGLIAVLLVALILIGREAAIVILIVVSPLAFVAYLLPNTESLFQKWWKMFTTLLLVFPIIGLVYGGSMVAARVLNAAASSASGAQQVTMQLMALAVMSLPFVAVPSILKGALNGLGSIGTKIGGLAGKPMSASVKGIGKNISERGQTAYNRSSLAQGIAARKAARESYHRAKFAKNLGKKGITGAIARGIQPPTASGKYVKESLDRRAQAAVREEELKDINSESRALNDESMNVNNRKPLPGGGTESETQYVGRMLEQALAQGNTIRARAAIQTLKSSGDGGVEQLQRSLVKARDNKSFDDSTEQGKESKKQIRSFINEHASDLIEKDARIANWADTGDDKDLTESDFSFLTDKQIASQTGEALKAAKDANGGAGAAGFAIADRARIRYAVEQGRIQMKSSKNQWFQ